MKRAVAVFLENKNHLIVQFFGLYASWKFIESTDTDLVVFGPADVLKFIPDDCVKVPCISISGALPWSQFRLPHPYYYINSIYFLCTPDSEILLNYDYVLKTDVDTFLTKKWNEFFPQSYTTGRGKYVYDSVTSETIKSISTALQLTHYGLHNLGATHYGKPEQILEVMKLTYSTSQYILENVFHEDLGTWPSLFYGVTTMYAGEIAVNHLVSDLIQAPDKMDCRADSPDTIEQQVHIHSPHTSKVFSKFEFEHGKYDEVDVSTLDKNIVSEYCLYIALSSVKIRDAWHRV